MTSLHTLFQCSTCVKKFFLTLRRTSWWNFWFRLWPLFPVLSLGLAEKTLAPWCWHTLRYLYSLMRSPLSLVLSRRNSSSSHSLCSEMLGNTDNIRLPPVPASVHKGLPSPQRPTIKLDDTEPAPPPRPHPSPAGGAGHRSPSPAAAAPHLPRRPEGDGPKVRRQRRRAGAGPVTDVPARPASCADRKAAAAALGAPVAAARRPVRSSSGAPRARPQQPPPPGRPRPRLAPLFHRLLPGPPRPPGMTMLALASEGLAIFGLILFVVLWLMHFMSIIYT